MQRVVISLVWLLASAAPAYAAQLPATPETVEKVILAARGGDSVVLTGNFPPFMLKGRTFNPSLILDARAATLTSWTFRDVSGLQINGGVVLAKRSDPKGTGEMSGTGLRFRNASHIRLENLDVQGPAANLPGKPTLVASGYGISFTDGSDVTVVNSKLSGFKNGLVLGRIDGFKILNNKFRRMGIDGLDLANSWNGLVEGNDFRENHKLDQAHPDAIQMWSRPTAKPTSDIVIRKNTVVGETQGITGFNHIRNGVDDGGFDRVTISENDIQVDHPQAIAVYSGRDVTITNNRVRTLPGAAHRASINLGGSTDVTRSGNVIEAGAGKAGIRD